MDLWRNSSVIAFAKFVTLLGYDKKTIYAEKTTQHSPAHIGPRRSFNRFVEFQVFARINFLTYFIFFYAKFTDSF